MHTRERRRTLTCRWISALCQILLLLLLLLLLQSLWSMMCLQMGQTLFSLLIYIFCCCFDANKVAYVVLMNHIFDHGVTLVQSFGLLTSKPNMMDETSWWNITFIYVSWFYWGSSTYIWVMSTIQQLDLKNALVTCHHLYRLKALSSSGYTAAVKIDYYCWCSCY